MDIGQRLKSLIFTDAPADASKSSGDVEAPATPTVSKKSSVIATPSATKDAESKIASMVDFITSVIEESAPKNEFGYLQFKTAVSSLIESGQSESTAISSTFTTAKTMGLSKSALLASAKQALSVVEQQKSEFDVNAQENEDNEVTAKQQFIDQTEAEIDRLRASKEKAEQEVVEAKSKLNTARFAFTEAYNRVKSAIADDMDKISKNIKEGK